MRHDSIIYKLTKDIVCDDAEECHKRIRRGLESKLRIRNTNPNSQSFSISTHHLPHDHQILLEFYMRSELPNELHNVELKILENIPDFRLFESKLNEVLTEENNALRRVINWVRRNF